MGDITNIRTALIAKAAGVAGVRGASVRLPDNIPASPWFVLAPHTATMPRPFGSRRATTYAFPLRLYIERQATDDQTMQTGDDLIDLTVVAFSQGITLGGLADEVVLEGWNADNWITLGDPPNAPGGGVPYLLIEFQLRVNATRTLTNTA